MEMNFMEMFSNISGEMEKDPGRPDRPFPLQPQPGLHPLAGGFPLRDEDNMDFILIYSDNISWGHFAFEILNAGAGSAIGE